MKKIIIFMLIIFSISFLGCIEKKQAVLKEKSSDLTYGISNMPRDLLMLNYENKRDEDLLCAFFEGLVQLNSNNTIVPALAESYDISKDGLTYVFKLRKNIYWSDGNEIKAQDFVNFFKDILSPGVDNIFYKELSCIYGAEDYYKGKQSFDKVAIRTLEDNMLQIRLNYVNSNLLNTLSKPRYRLRKNFSDLKDWMQNYKKILFTGAYKINNISLKDGEALQLIKNERYYDKEKISSHKININSYSSKEVAMAKYDVNELDFILDIPISEVERLISKEKIFLLSNDRTFCITFNFRKDNIFSNEKVRQFIVKALDTLTTEEFLDKVNIKLAKDTFFPSNKGLQKEKAVISNNIEKDSATLAELKDKKRSVRLICANNDKSKYIAQKIAKDLKLNSELEVYIRSFNDIEMNEAIDKGEYDIVLKDFINTDKENFLKNWSSNNSENIYKYNNPEYDSILSKYIYEKDPLKKEEYYLALNNILKKEAVIIPLFYDSVLVAKNESIKGLYVDGNKNIILKDVYKIAESKENNNEIYHEYIPIG